MGARTLVAPAQPVSSEWHTPGILGFSPSGVFPYCRNTTISIIIDALSHILWSKHGTVRSAGKYISSRNLFFGGTRSGLGARTNLYGGEDP